MALLDVFCNLVGELGETITVRDVLAGRAEHANAPTATQMDVVKAIEQHQRVLVKGGNKQGKSHLIPRLALAMLYEEPGNIVVVTSVKGPSLRALWGGIKQCFLQIQGAVENRIVYYTLTPDPRQPRWYMQGLTTKPNAEESFAGHHADTGKTYILMDEASGIHPSVWLGLEGMLANDNCHAIAFGNPLSINCEFFTAYESGEWFPVTFDARQHANTRHQRQIYRGAVSPGWAQARTDAWGPRDARTIARVNGDFPDRADNAIIPLATIREAVGITPVNPLEKCAAGVDVARFGTNASMGYVIDGGYLEEEFEVFGDRATGKGDAKDIAKRISRLCTEMFAVAVDEDGIGGPVMDFVDRDPECLLIRYNAGSDSLHERRMKKRDAARKGTSKAKPRKKKYANLASEQWWLFGQAIKNKQVSLPDDKQLHRQLGDRLFTLPDGVLTLETKDQYMKRTLQPSPDKADAAVDAYFAWTRANLHTGEHHASVGGRGLSMPEHF